MKVNKHYYEGWQSPFWRFAAVNSLESTADHIECLPGAKVTDFITDNITEAWIDFSYCGHRFAVNDQFGEFWFFVENPMCPVNNQPCYEMRRRGGGRIEQLLGGKLVVRRREEMNLKDDRIAMLQPPENSNSN